MSFHIEAANGLRLSCGPLREGRLYITIVGQHWDAVKTWESGLETAE